jgi:hypothetical protein
MRLRSSFSSVLLTAGALLAAIAAAQEDAPLRRAFSAGAEQRYVVFLHLTAELKGQRPEQIGARQYVQPFANSAAYEVSWRATRRVLAPAANELVEIEEMLDEFAGVSGVTLSGAEGQEMIDALRQALELWSRPQTLRYRETSAGQLLGLRSEAAPALGENSPPVVTLWLLRALRPTAALPPHPVRFGRKWQEPRAVEFKEWSGITGIESGEWLEAPSSPGPAVRLHITQQIIGRIAAGADWKEAGEASARFYAESLHTLALDDTRLLSAERSASREISWELKNVPGLAEPQRFRARVSVQVQIDDCRNDPCLAADRRGVLRRRD